MSTENEALDTTQFEQFAARGDAAKTERPMRKTVSDARFTFKDDLPATVNTEAGEYVVKCETYRSTSDAYFLHEIERDREGHIRVIKFDNNEAAGIFISLYNVFKNSNRSMVEDAQELERALAADEIHPTIKRSNKHLNEESDKDLRRSVLKDSRTLEFGDNNLFDEQAEDIIEWIKELQERKIPIVTQRTLVQTGRRPIDIKRIKIGEIGNDPKENFAVEQEVIATYVFGAEKLKLPIPPKTLIVDAQDYGYTRTNGKLGSRLERFSGTRGRYMRGLILLSETASTGSIEGEDTSLKVYTGLRRDLVRHESGHSMDWNVQLATRPQVEGFAVSVEYDFSFERCKHDLRVKENYGRDITQEKLFEILGRNPPRDLPKVESYILTASFYTWLYQKLGPDAFMRFYDKLTGGTFETKHKPIPKAYEAFKRSGDKTWYTGNVLHCLDSLNKNHRWTWESPEALVKNYLEDVNRPE